MMRKMRYPTTAGLAAALSLLWVASGTWAQEEDPREAKAERLETLLIAPCCWRQPISDHQSGEATRMKGEIRSMLDEGKTEQEILDHYVEMYGARILSIPPQEGFNRMSFLMPLFFTVAGLVLVGVVLRRWRHHSAEPSTPEDSKPEEPVLDEKMSRRIQNELDAMDED